MRGFKKLRTMALPAMVLLIAGCSNVDAAIVTRTLSIGDPVAQQQWHNGRAAAMAILTIPDGGLADANRAELSLVVTFNTDNESEVEIEVSGFANETVRVPSGDGVFDIEARLPDGCDAGCDVEALLVATHLGAGEPPSLNWRVGFRFIYGSESIPVPQKEFEVEFLPVEPPPAS